MPITHKKEVTFKAKLYRELYYNHEKAYGITMVVTKDEIDYVQNGITTIVGNYCQIDEGIEYTVIAEAVKNEKFGWQYKTINVYCDNFADTDTMRNYLYSILPKDKTDLLLEHYPDFVKQILEDTSFEPDYDILPGIASKSFKKIKDKILNTYLLSEILALLSPIGVSFTMIKRIAESESNISLLKQKILENPYMLTKIPMLSFKKVDAFAIKLHPDFKNSKFRMMAAIQYEMEVLGEEDGHTWVDKRVLRSALKMLVPEVIGLFDEFIEEERVNTIIDKPSVLYVDEHRCGLYRTYLMEKFIYEKLETIRTNNNIYDTENFDEMVQKANDYLGFVLDEQQQTIIKSIATNNVTAITGKAGTGKTSLVKGILSVYQDKSFAICTLAAKAARRVVEVTGFRDAKTIHRTLEFNPVDGFVKNEDNILFVDILIIDEASMVNVFLFYSILKALPNKCKVIIVGDNMQLPPIGSGAPFTDILNHSKQFNILKLAKIYRQAEDSGIVMDANQIRDGIMPFDRVEPFMIRGVKRDMLYLFKNKREDIQKAILDIFMEYIKKGVNIADVNVQLPRKDDCLNSTKQINTKLQALLIPQGTPFLQVTSNKLFYLGDRVLNTSNNYSKDVMNGEIGTVTDVMSNSIIIDFDGNEIEFSKEECDALELGYALTVHKMQGSSNKYIIIGLDNTHRIKTLLSSNSIYTAATRAEIKCVIIAEPSAFRYGVHNTSENERQTFLPDFLK